MALFFPLIQLVLGIFKQLLKLADALKFDEEPKYDHYVEQMIKSVPHNRFESLDWVMDWT